MGHAPRPSAPAPVWDSHGVTVRVPVPLGYRAKVCEFTAILREPLCAGSEHMSERSIVDHPLEQNGIDTHMRALCVCCLRISGAGFAHV